MDKTEYAFPQTKQVGDVAVGEGGLTLRDYFAAKAMAMFFNDDEGTYTEVIADMAYDMADAMMDARKK